MGTHLNRTKDGSKRHKRGFSESRDIPIERRQRISFKKFVAELEERLIELDEEYEELDELKVPDASSDSL